MLFNFSVFRRLVSRATLEDLVCGSLKGITSDKFFITFAPNTIINNTLVNVTCTDNRANNTEKHDVVYITTIKKAYGGEASSFY